MTTNESYLLSKLVYNAAQGLTRDDILFNDAHLIGLGRDEVQRLLNSLELLKFAKVDLVAGRGEVYRPTEAGFANSSATVASGSTTVQIRK